MTIPKTQASFRSILVLYGVVLFFLFLYSFTQVDLNLTLSRIGIVQGIQKSFQYIGFYQRTWSAVSYLIIIGVLYFLYWRLIRNLESAAGFTRKIFFRYLMLVIGILFFSYPAFSYDIFNYTFTARTVVLYHKNPYIVIPLQFWTIDPWVSFMRWIHLPSAYTPLWILLTIPAYVFGFGSVLLTLWNIKLIVAASYVITTVLIGKILDIMDPKKAVLGMALFALNPLVLIETLVSSHNDMVMMAMATGAFYLYVSRRRWSSYIALSLSVAAKLMTVFLFPLYWLGWKREYVLGAMTIGFVLVLFQREVLPWYFVWLAPFIALLPRNRPLQIVGGGLSLGLLLRYAPYLYLGDWNTPAPFFKFWGTVVPVALACLLAFWPFRRVR